MKGENNWKGAITVYLSIILSSVILLSGILMDIARIRTAEVQVKRAVNTAAVSALAGYHTKLKEDYGLFGLHNNDSIQLEETIRNYLDKNLMLEPEKGSAYDFLKSIVINDEYRSVRFIDLYDYRIEAIEVVPVYNFTENEITRQQIAEYMKYRAPAQFAENLMEKLKYVSDTAQHTDAYRQKTAIEKKLARVEKSLVKLQNEIDVLNSFVKDSFSNTPDSGSLLQSYIEEQVKKSVYEVYESVDIETSGLEEEQETAEELARYAHGLYKAAVRDAGDKQEHLEGEISKGITAAQNALRDIKEIQALSASARSDIAALKSSLKAQDNGETAGETQINAALYKDIEKWEKLLDDEDSDSVLEKLENNMLKLKIIQSNFIQIPHLSDSMSSTLLSAAERNMENALEAAEDLDISGTPELDAAVRKILSAKEPALVSKSAKSFETIAEVFVKGGKKKGKDPRKAVAEDAKKLRDDISGMSEQSKRIEDIRILPSYRINGSYPNKLFSDDKLQQDKEENPATSLQGADVGFDEESSFSEDTFGFITALADKLKGYAKTMRDEIYVNEYILSVFKDKVEIEGSSTDGKIKDTLFDNCEVEYILTGAAGETQNYLAVKGEILLIRFGMNTLHVYSDPQKRLKALEIATAAAGLTGFGIPIVHNLLMCTWGMAESFQDVGDIYQGKKVPFIKTAETWRTDLMPSGYSTNGDVEAPGGMMDFDYHDYLRLLLLVQNKEVKMNRIEDLIQVNIQKSNPEFQLKNYNTYIKVNVKVSMKYWFLTGSFVPSDRKTNEGRHLIYSEAWKGY